MSIVFLFIAISELKYHINNVIEREKLPVMRMSRKLNIDTELACICEIFGLMIHEDSR